MQKPTYSPERNAQLLVNRIEELRSRLDSYDPNHLATSTGTEFKLGEDGQHGEFHTTVWKQAVRITYPEYHVYEEPSGKECGAALQGLVLYYYLTADGSPPGDTWISFTELPDGRFYTQAFQGYTGEELGRVFGNDLAGFEQAALRVDGHKENLGNAAFSFELLPRVSLMAVCWLGDEDFPTKYQILFSSNMSHYLPTDAGAIAGSMLTRKLLAAYSTP